MIRTTLFSSFCLLALAAVPGSQASEFETPRKSDPALEAIQKQLLEIQISLQSLKAQDTEVRLRKLELELSGIKEQLNRMEASVKASTTETRKALSINPPAPSPTGIIPAVAPTGTLRLSNTSAYFASVNVNGSIYRVAPGQLLPITNQPAGEFRYEVMADGFGMIQPPSIRTLAPNEVFTVFIYPR